MLGDGAEPPIQRPDTRGFSAPSERCARRWYFARKRRCRGLQAPGRDGAPRPRAGTMRLFSYVSIGVTARRRQLPCRELFQTKVETRTMSNGDGTKTTRILGSEARPKAAPAAQADTTQPPGPPAPPPVASDEYDPLVGWFVIQAGPGKGSFVPIYEGMNSVGRGRDQRVVLDFGDNRIVPAGHFFVTYEPKGRKFYLNHGSQTNLVYVNNSVVLAPIELHSGNVIELGATKLRLLPLCGPDFQWGDPQ